MAVANSKESLPLPSLVRIKTGMASCNRAHLRSSFFDNLRDTRLHHLIRGINTQTAPQGPNFGAESSRPGIVPNLASNTEITEVPPQPPRFKVT